MIGKGLLKGLVVVLLLCCAVSAFAGVPQTINYQGYLKDTASNTPVSGPVDITFALYDLQTGGTSLWSEMHPAVPVNNGIYSVRLGSIDPSNNPLNQPFDREYFIGISVNGGSELTPRQALTSVPYAMKSITVETVPCLPGDSLSCYSGPEGTKGIGRCTGGIRICSPTGAYGACIGEVLPVAEICINTIDDNCNGQKDEGCTFPTGSLCTLGSECASSFCIDGHCCDTACSGLCESCDSGTCSPIVVGTDPANECTGTGTCGGVCDGARACMYPPANTDCGTCARCSGNGLCVPVGADTDPGNSCTTCRTCDGIGACKLVANGQDPQNDCSDQGPCGLDGMCNGSGACRYYGVSTIFAPASCNAGTNIYSYPDTCSGLGTVNDGGTASCNPYTCSTAICRTGCTQQSDCATGFFCDISGTYGQIGVCLAKRTDGSACSNDTRDFECAGGYCNNGFCCTNSTGSCCAADANCSSLAQAATCDSTSTCSGYRVDATCSASVCQTAKVSDPSGCNGQICAAGSCSGTGGLSWTPQSQCNISGTCKETSSPTNCDDGALCTNDFCSPSSGCSHINNTVSRACYSGPQGTENIGLCHGGTQTCSGGSFGACVGEVVPATETCSGNTDENCNGQINEQNAVGCTYYRLDNDYDTFGILSPTPRCYCAPGIAYLGASPDNYTATNSGLTDCNDNNASVHPGRAETCSTAYDDNCDGAINENGASGCVFYSQDLDRDGYGNMNGPAAECRCTATVPWDSINRTDCNDSVASISPGRTEICNGIDDNCNGSIDDGSIASLCPNPANASNSGCYATLGCKPVCNTYWYDVDSLFANGCEVQQDAYDRSGNGNSCPTAVPLGSLSELGTTSDVTANILPSIDTDWYSVTANDDQGGGTVRFDMRFLVNPGSAYSYDLYRTNCSTLVASGQTGNSLQTLPGAYFIRVHRPSGTSSPAGDNYQIRFSNGVY